MRLESRFPWCRAALAGSSPGAGFRFRHMVSPGSPSAATATGGMEGSLGSRMDAAGAAGATDQHGALRGVIASCSTAGTLRLGDAAPKGTGHHSDGGAATGWPLLSSPLCSTSSPWPPLLAGLFIFFRWLCLPSSPGQEMSRAGSVKPGRFVVWAVSVCPCAPRCALSQPLDCTGQNPPPEGVDSIRTAVNASWRHKDPKCNEHPRCLDAPGAPRGSAPHRGVGWMCTVLEGAMAMGTTWLLSTK